MKAAWALPSDDLVPWVNSERTRQDLHKQSGWTEVLRTGIWLNKLWFTVLIKSVHLNALDCSNQKMIWETLTQQNPYLREIELIHVNKEWACQADFSVKVFTVLVNMASLQQTNLLIQKELILDYVHHAVELFHQDCQIICCFQCQSLSHMICVCHHKVCCDWCASD